MALRGLSALELVLLEYCRCKLGPKMRPKTALAKKSAGRNRGIHVRHRVSNFVLFERKMESHCCECWQCRIEGQEIQEGYGCPRLRAINSQRADIASAGVI